MNLSQSGHVWATKELTGKMEDLIIEAYRKAEIKTFFVITTHVERLLKQYYSLRDERTWITTGEVRRILEHHGLAFDYGWAGA